MKIIGQWKNASKAHQYDVEVMDNQTGEFGIIVVDASTRMQAAKMVQAENYQVRSVNMVA